MRAAAIAALAIFVVSLFADATAVATDRSTPNLWGFSEVRSTNLRLFAKWTSTLSRYETERLTTRRPGCAHPAADDCRTEEWQRFLESVRDQDRRSQIASVNAFINARPYVADQANWNRSDYWATPAEFLARSGDCEDYAIAKYLALRELGWSDRELRIVAVKDLHKGIGHAVTVAFLDGEAFVLDNQLNKVTEVGAIGHYRPVYSLNATAWWHHHEGPDA